MPSRAVRILVVDDEPALLESMRSYLLRLGHQVSAFRSGTEAWESLASAEHTPSVVIVDLTLPGMTGAEFIRKMMERDPNIAIVATSGYPMSLESIGKVSGRLAMLQKPFTPRMLNEVLNRLLADAYGAAQ